MNETIQTIRTSTLLATLLMAVALPAAGQEIQWTKAAGPDGGRVISLENHEGTLYAGTEGGVYRFDEGRQPCS